MQSPLSRSVPVTNSPEVARSSSDLLADFLRLKISANTRRNYGKAIVDFCRRTYDCEVSERLMTQFLSLQQPEAVYQALQYRQQLIEAKLSPSTINVRLSALKSFVDYARQAEQCSFNLADVTYLKVESYVQRPTILITPDHNHRDFETTLAATINAVETELSATETTLFATSPQY